MELILHIGQQKTGSTSLQAFLEKNYELLLHHKILYPRSLGKRNRKQNLLITLCKDGSLMKDENLVKDFEAELATGDIEKVIISDENFYPGKKRTINQVAKFLSPYFERIRIVCYLKVQHEHMPSSFQQSVRGTRTHYFKDWIEQRTTISNYYDYPKILDRWQKAFPAAQIELRIFNTLLRKDIRYDFVDLIDPKLMEIMNFEDTRSLNLGFDKYSTILLSAINKLTFTEEFGPPLPVKIRDRYMDQVKNQKAKAKLKLDNRTRLKVWKRFIDTNISLIEKYDLDHNAQIYLLKKPSLDRKEDIRIEEEVLFNYLSFLEKY